MKTNGEKKWMLQGNYFESCNCNVSCPCLINEYGNNMRQATNVHCDLILGYLVDEGNFEGVDLAGCKFAMGVLSPGPLMVNPNWSVAYYIDEDTTAAQRDALTLIITGEVGGPLAGIASLRERDYGVKFVKIDFVIDGPSWKLNISGIAESELKPVGVRLYEDEDVAYINVHPQAYHAAQALAGKSVYEDFDMKFDNSGKSGIRGKFDWTYDNAIANRPAKR